MQDGHTKKKKKKKGVGRGGGGGIGGAPIKKNRGKKINKKNSVQGVPLGWDQWSGKMPILTQSALVIWHWDKILQKVSTKSTERFLRSGTCFALRDTEVYVLVWRQVCNSQYSIEHGSYYWECTVYWSDVIGQYSTVAQDTMDKHHCKLMPIVSLHESGHCEHKIT